MIYSFRYLKHQISSKKRKVKKKMMTDDEDFGGSYEGSAIFDPKFPDYDEIRFLPANTVPPMTMRFPVNPTDQWENSGDLDELEIGKCYNLIFICRKSYILEGLNFKSLLSLNLSIGDSGYYMPLIFLNSERKFNSQAVGLRFC